MKQRILSGVVLTAVLAVGGWLMWNLTHRDSARHSDDTLSEHDASASAPFFVTLSDVQESVSGIEVATIVQSTVQPERTVPGRLTYDDTRHIEVRVPTAGTLREVLVKPGDSVAAGTVLARISSPEVGLARADVLRREAELRIAITDLDRSLQLRDGLNRLVDAVQRGENAPQILDDMQGTRLGPYRERIVAAYSRLNLASQLAANLRTATESGAIAARTLQEREGEKTTATAALKGLIEESLYESERACATSEIAVSDARRRLRIARQQLETLLGYPETVDDSDAGPPLSLVEVKAPFAGTIEAKNFSRDERVEAGDSLCVLADTSSLWVSADIREKEWGALRLSPGAEVSVTTPALPDQVLSARLYFLGRVVSPETNAVPLMATLKNGDGLLRPGQFVRVRLPVGAPLSGLTVPESAIVEHEGRAFVFQPDGRGRYRRVDVTVSLVQNGTALIQGALNDGDQVVSRGVFVLKSRLLLENED